MISPLVRFQITALTIVAMLWCAHAWTINTASYSDFSISPILNPSPLESAQTEYRFDHLRSLDTNAPAPRLQDIDIPKSQAWRVTANFTGDPA